MAIYITGNVILNEKNNPNGYPVADPLELTRHKDDPWPLKADLPALTNRSVFLELDSGKVYWYDAAFDCWRDDSGTVVSVTV